MTDSPSKVFIDSNMLIFAADFKKENILEWMDSLYDEIYLHIDVYEELLTSSIRKKVETFAREKQWVIFDPFDTNFLTKPQQDIYRNRLMDVKDAFHRMNMVRIKNGQRVKTVSNLEEMATLAACMMINAQIICSNDFDIRTLIEQEDYRIMIDQQELPILQVSAEDFCFDCFQSGITSRKNVRAFY